MSKAQAAAGVFTTLGLASFNKYPNGGGPQDSTETYNYMKGLNGDGSPGTRYGTARSHG